MLDLTLVTASDVALPVEPAEVRHLINRVWCDCADRAPFDRVSPAHGVVVTRAAKGGAAETEAAIAAARAAFDDGRWSELSRKERATLLLKFADLPPRAYRPHRDTRGR